MQYDSIYTSETCEDLRHFMICKIKFFLKGKKHKNMNFIIEFTLEVQLEVGGESVWDHSVVTNYRKHPHP